MATATRKASVRRASSAGMAAKAPARPVKAGGKPAAQAGSPPLAAAPAKPAKDAKPAKAAKAAKPSKADKPRKPKLVRDSFTIPKPEYVVLDTLKARALKTGKSVKKSELLRAGIKALAALPDLAFAAALDAVPALKTGRPAKG